MLFTAIITLLLSVVALALPAVLEARADNSCVPSNYTIAGFNIKTMVDATDLTATVGFNFKSHFADLTDITDVIANGTTCTAVGAPIPNSNTCNDGQRKLLWDLREPEEKTHYQIAHTWVCNG